MTILVIGDPMIDRYISGMITRKSPEDPNVNVFSVSQATKFPGGCLNAAMNLAALAPTATVLAVAPMSEDTLNNVLPHKKRMRVATSSIPEHLEITKMRIMSMEKRPRQLLRMDFNAKFPQSVIDDSNNLISKFVRPGNDLSAIVVSDYDKGIINSQTIDMLSMHATCPVFIDTKKPDLKIWEGIENYFIKINDREYSKATGIDYSTRVVFTSGKEGAAYQHEGSATYFPTTPVANANPIGAGDVFLAALVASYTSTRNPSILSAIRFANRAARAAVQKPGTPVVTLEDVEKEIDEFIEVEGSWCDRAQGAI